MTHPALLGVCKFLPNQILSRGRMSLPLCHLHLISKSEQNMVRGCSLNKKIVGWLKKGWPPTSCLKRKYINTNKKAAIFKPFHVIFSLILSQFLLQFQNINNVSNCSYISVLNCITCELVVYFKPYKDILKKKVNFLDTLKYTFKWATFYIKVHLKSLF